MEHNSANLYWKQFINEASYLSDQSLGYDDVFHFGSKEEAAKIATLVLSGIKTSTASVAWIYDFEKRAIPEPGSYSIVTNGNNWPLCIIQTTEVRTIPFDEVDERFAFEGGEEDRTLISWRKLYWDYIQSECLRINKTPTNKIPMVCERFMVAYKEPFLHAYER